MVSVMNDGDSQIRCPGALQAPFEACASATDGEEMLAPRRPPLGILAALGHATRPHRDLTMAQRRTSEPDPIATLADAKALVKEVEDFVQQDPDEAFREVSDGKLRLVCPPHAWDAGRFVTPTIGELKARLSTQPDAGTAPITLRRLTGSKHELDVGRLQAAAPPRTLFQVASQFNCLEAPGPDVTSIARYFGDNTQGPRAAVSAFPGTFVRHYRCPAPDGSTFVQSDARGFDLLADAAGKHSGVRRGYLQTDNVADPGALAEALTDRFDQIRVGIQASVEVALGADWFGPVPDGQPIDQVFASTIALGYSKHRNAAAFAPVRTRLLRAAYLGTLLAALDLGDQRVLLTLIGGGVFGNPVPDIVAAIHWAAAEASALCALPLAVYVNDFSGHPELAELPAATTLG
jgi:hypothetical protein